MTENKMPDKIYVVASYDEWINAKWVPHYTAREQWEGDAQEYIRADLVPTISKTETTTVTDLTRCPKCQGVADNGFDRCDPPNAYNCTKCEAVTDESNSVATHDSARAKREALNDLFWMKQLIEDRTETMDFSKTELDGAYETIRATLQTLSDEDLRAITSTKMDTKYDYLNRELEEQARLNGMGAERERSGCDLAVTDEAKREALEHCKDCCCARSWKALGNPTYNGMAIDERITALRESHDRLLEQLKLANRLLLIKDGGYKDSGFYFVNIEIIEKSEKV